MKQVLTAGCIWLLVAPCALAPVAAAQDTPDEARAALLERGAYLTNAVAGCNDCHTPLTPLGPDRAKRLWGADLPFEPKEGSIFSILPFAANAPAIAGLPDGYSTEQFARLLRTGLKPNGLPPIPPMPQYRMNQADARAIAAYVASLPKPPS